MILEHKVFFNSPSLGKKFGNVLPKVSFTISINNLISTSNKLRSIIHKVNKSFSKCDFMICDTLNRFNIMMDDDKITEQNAREIAFKQGSDWLKQNQNFLSEISINHDFIRWDSWLNHTKYALKLKLVEEEYNRNLSYKEAFYNTAAIYLSRRSLGSDLHLNLCIQYLKEECAVMLLWADEKYNFEMYPGKRNFAMEKTHEIFIKPNFDGILLPIKIDVRYKNKKEQEIATSALNSLLKITSGHVYIKDRDGYYLYCNESQAKSLCLKVEEIIGKTDYDLSSADKADKYRQADLMVINSGNYETIEESAYYNNKCATFLSTKSPFYGKNGGIMGVIGLSVDITAKKEAEILRVENQAHKIAALQQEQFKEIVGQVNHDIRSPLASLQILTNQCAHLLPENQRESYNKAISRITDIANNMMNYFKPKDKWEEILKLETNNSLLVSTELLEVLAEKKYEYIKKPIEFIYNFSQSGNFAFININACTFERMISNILNNAVDALEDKSGVINIKLDVKDNIAEIIIEDNGKGMPDNVKDKIMNNEVISAGKKNGYGIGLTQVRQALENNRGKLNIESELGLGTKITITFPKATTPNWMVERIKLEKDNLVVIVDDSPSIHDAWDSRFKVEAPKITIKHFEIGEEVVNYLNNLSDIERQKVLLLTDYELLKQNINGLDIIKKSNIKNAILVTSYYANSKVREVAGKENIKILPKSLSVDVPIIFREKIIANSKKVDMVWVDDAREFINDLITRYYSHLKVDAYYNPSDFLKDVKQYPLDTKIILDGFYCDDSGFTIIADGITIAKKLHASGYNNLYLTSSEDIPEQMLPSYVTFISKHNVEKMIILDKLQK
ncbi:MAG TPA: PAS domain-containing sensor histidine kinase [Burkholderiales bacterium]|nr:PAS domain-containing sensor histidine kinase [Burkholderiales bacterium]